MVTQTDGFKVDHCPTGKVTSAYLPVLKSSTTAGRKIVAIPERFKVQSPSASVAVSGEPKVSIQAYHVSAGSNHPPMHRVVIHTAECACVHGAAVGIGRYFTSPSSGGSAHYGVDPDDEQHYVHEAAIAWHAPPNQYSLGIEIAGTASWTKAQWKAANAQAALHRAAARTADLCHRYGLPVVWLSPNDLLSGKRGITGHVCVSQAWHQSTHTDPGPNFPVKQFLSLVSSFLHDKPQPSPTPRPTVVTALKRALGVSEPGWGKKTDQALARLRDTHPGSGRAAIKALQKQVGGLRVDGIWGPHTDAAVRAAIEKVQKALGVTQDGYWGPRTQQALARARAAHYKP